MPRKSVKMTTGLSALLLAWAEAPSPSGDEAPLTTMDGESVFPISLVSGVLHERPGRGKRFHVLPWQMAIIGWLLRRLPRPVYDALFVHAPRKPRRFPDVPGPQ